jgi:hypothetical protein
MTTTLQSVELISQEWTTLHEILFRFFSFVLYCFLFPVVSFQFTQPLTYPTRFKHFFLAGKWETDSIKVMLKKYDLNNYRLYRSKFKWIVD